MKLPNYKRLSIEDYSQEEQPMVEKLSSTINPGIETLYNGLQNRLTFRDNFDATQKTLDIQVNASGTPTTVNSFKLNLVNNTIPRATGVQCFAAVNLTKSTVYPVSAPWISFTQNKDQITINNISGLLPGYVWSLTIVVIHN